MLAKGKVLNSRYRIIRHLKSGGMGAVYEAFDMALKARVVIKENCKPEEELAFQREAQLLANLRHPSLPYCSHLFSSARKKQYLVMEFIEGDDLSTLQSKTRAPFKAELVMDWARQLLDVLDYIHGEAVLHRDIKPSNIKVIKERVYLLDFGLAYGQTDDMDTLGNGEFNWNCCSGYSSPEQLESKPTSPASDLYALAATLYKLLTAIQPVNALNRSLVATSGEGDPLEDILIHNPELDTNVARTIMQALSIEPDERPQSARQMREMMFPEKSLRPKPIDIEILPVEVKKSRRMLVATVILCAPLVLLIPALSHRLQPVDSVPALASAPNITAEQYADEAERLKQAGDYEKAREIITKGLSLYPNNAYVHQVYGDLLWDLMAEMAESVPSIGEVREQAEIILSLAQSPNSEKEFIARSWAYLAKGELDAALDDIEKALSFNPDSGQALMLRGSIKYQKAMLLGKESLKSASAVILDDYDRAIDRMRDYSQAYINRARIRTTLGDFNLAIVDVEKAISLQPERANFYVALGDVYYESKNYQEARRNYQTAIRKNPDCYKAYLGLADIFYFHEGDWKNAAAAYLSANKIHKTGYAFGQIGLAYYSLGKFEDAKKNFIAALQYKQGDFTSRQGLAHAYVGLKDFKSALDSYNNALASAPKTNLNFMADLYRERAEVYRQLGQEELAVEDEKRVENLGE